jgi:hypothetical protein
MLFAAMHFPDEIDTGEETVPSEEAFLILLKRLAYPMRPYQSDIQKFWPVAQILTNCHTCFYGSQTSRYFNLRPPSVEVYLSMGANLPLY